MKDRTAFLEAITRLTVRDPATGAFTSPSYEELRQDLGFKSRGSVHHVIGELISAGLVISTRPGGRGLVVVNLDDRRLDALADAAVKVTREGGADLRDRFHRAFAETLSRVG